MAQIPSLNGLRAISVLMVIASHLAQTHTAPETVSAVLPLFDGALGVRIFFCISGFLITYLLLIEKKETSKIALGKFYARRSVRIIPVSYVFIFALFMISNFTTLTITPCQFLTALTYTKNYACGSWIDGHLWSLAVEEQYYLVWPFLIAWLPLSTLKRIAALAILIAPLSRALEYINGSRLCTWLPSNADALMVGSLAAIFSLQQPALLGKLVKFRPAFFRLIAVAIIALPVILNRHLLFGKFTVTLGPTLQALSATYLICSYAYHRRGISYTVLNTNMLWYLGMLSYSLYIWQELFLADPEIYGVRRSIILEWPVNVIGVFVTAMVSYHLFERPLMAIRKKLRPSKESACATVSERGDRCTVSKDR